MTTSTSIQRYKFIKETTDILLQINDHKAYKLIEDLEALHIVKILKKGEFPKGKLS